MIRLALTERVHELHGAVAVLSTDVSAGRAAQTAQLEQLRVGFDHRLNEWRDSESAALKEWVSRAQHELLSTLTDTVSSKLLPPLKSDILSEVKSQIETEVKQSVATAINALKAELRTEWVSQMQSVWAPRVLSETRQDVTLQVLNVRDELQTVVRGIQSAAEQNASESAQRVNALNEAISQQHKQFSELHTHTQQLTHQLNTTSAALTATQKEMAELKQKLQVRMRVTRATAAVCCDAM